ncbi:ketoacyl-ACP synthase III [Paenibacillus sp. J22TS3]|uniref:ketoacyl-ACP synthase III n=1 Tax=Paenibacillus sp. J22TS3 TaxID=2807192 RepID=UPI001B2CAD40|nr:ketoacyl-ACP synthase III [Paenibacillus sp. J22TS3]GIP21996.1 3-oxoacyl-ACP synthase [Paenibacillus sp. J22TS3]
MQVHIKGIATYHPAQAYDNAYFVEHFDKLGLEAEGLMNHLGRKTRYLVSTEEENSLSMGVTVAKKLLAESKVSAEELDMVVFVSDTPEYTYPSNALLIHREIGAVNAHIVYDLNTNCIGMLTAMDQVRHHLIGNRYIKRALIIGSVHVSNIARKDDTIVYPNFSDGAAAVILEKTELPGGFIDANYKTDSKLGNTVMFPAAGMSAMFRDGVAEADKRLRFDPHDVSYFSDEWKNLITLLLGRNGMLATDVDHWIFSQFSRPEIEETLEKMHIELDKYTFVGDRYGYTGVTSPVFALEDALRTGRVSAGDKVVLCSVGIGYTMSSLLYQL